MFSQQPESFTGIKAKSLLLRPLLFSMRNVYPFLEVLFHRTLRSQQAEGETRVSALLTSAQALWVLPAGGPTQLRGAVLHLRHVSLLDR